ncbi:MAG: AmmeMemoRadiSam system protein A [Melioribacteraceae bacterium]|nr:AmmeMemoRadiSam system protein A [Melioribacteraceae bacterium]
MELSIRDKKQLLSLARFSIETFFRPPQTVLDPIEDSDILKSKSGAFVTITLENNLRGCIGYIESDEELTKTVMDAAYQAAFNDPRFQPLGEDEFENISLEISILSPPFPLKNYDEILLGKHGLILEEAGRKGLLLPQVPIEHGMNRDEYLSALCNKAGFFEDYWREKQLSLKAFTANVFSEKDEELI